MGKKSRAKKEPLTKPNPTGMSGLIEDYLKAKAALESGSGIVFFQGQPVTRESLSEQFFAAGEARGLSRMNLLIELTVATN